MSEIWKRWEGQVIDHKYQLRHFIGSTDHSAVFAAEYRDPEPRKAAVKFLSGDLPHAEQVLADWKRVQQLNHPNLLQIYAVGRCKIEDMELLYAAMEYAEENLAEILPHRALTTEEAREMLGTVADVLVFLHGKKLTHGHLKPSNVLAIGNLLKVSSDTIQALDEPRDMGRERDAYDAPEIPASPYTPAADVWSLGVTLVETLTQQPAFLPFNENAEPVIAQNVRDPFREIAHRALRREATSRWSTVEIAEFLNPAAAQSPQAALAAAAANASSAPAASSVAVAAAPPAPAPPGSPSPTTAPVSPPVSPLSVPLSKEPAVPLSKLPIGVGPVPKPPMPPPAPVSRPAAKPESRAAVVLPNYVLPLFAGLLIIVAIFALPKILHRRAESAAAPSPSPNAAVQPTAPSSAPQVSNPVRPNPPTNTKPATPPPTSTVPPAATLHNSASAVTPTPKTANATPGRGEVLDQILPRPSSSALATVSGTVRVIVRVHVDAAGNVTDAALENAGPSKYFAEKSVQAAHGWVFSPPDVDGHSQPSQWLIRFEFTPSGIHAYPTQAQP